MASMLVVLSDKVLRFLPPSQHDGGEWNLVCSAHRIENVRKYPKTNVLDNFQTSPNCCHWNYFLQKK